MKPLWTTIARYLVGAAAVGVGIFLIALPSLVIAAIADNAPPNLGHLILGLIIGLPVAGAGVTFARKRYRLTLYLAFSAGIVHTVIPVILGFGAMIAFVPAIIDFSIISLALVAWETDMAS